jgi:hypothetical protein
LLTLQKTNKPCHCNTLNKITIAITPKITAILKPQDALKRIGRGARQREEISSDFFSPSNGLQRRQTDDSTGTASSLGRLFFFFVSSEKSIYPIESFGVLNRQPVF